MDKLHFSGFLLILMICLFLAVSADIMPIGNNTSAEKWLGTWIGENDTITFYQNGTEIIGIGSDDYAPFKLIGTISDDGKLLQAVMTDTGRWDLQISGDKMSFLGTSTLNSIDNISESSVSVINATRYNATTKTKDNWAGEWLTINNSVINLTQDGDVISGTAYPVNFPEYIAELNGIVSDDGKSMSVNWSASQNIGFYLSDDGKNLIETECGEVEIANGEECFNLTKEN